MGRTTVLLSVFSLLVLCTGQQGRAGEIAFQANLTAQGSFVPLPPYYYLSSASSLDVSGDATAITGFPSLVGINPSNLTFTLTGLALDVSESSSTFPFSGNMLTASYHGSTGAPALLDFFLSGTPIAEFAAVAVVENAQILLTGPPLYETLFPATAAGSGVLDSAFTSAFTADVLNQTAGGGVLDINVDPFNALAATLPASFSITGDFSTVPEPGSLSLVGVAVMCISGYAWRRRCRTA